MLLLMQQGFFTPEQQVRLAEAIIAIFVAVPAILTGLGVWLQVRNNRNIQALLANSNESKGTLNAIASHTGNRATDTGNVIQGNVRGVQVEGMDSPGDGAFEHEERRRDASPDILRPATLHQRDADDANQHRGPI